MALPDWTQWPALVIAAFTFVVLFRGQPKDTPWIVFSGIFSFLSARIGSQILGPEIGGFIAALLLATASNIFSRLSSRPGAIVQVPGLILLVPGSVGYRGVISLLSHDTIGGLETAFTMFLTAISLVAGLLFANVIFARKRPI